MCIYKYDRSREDYLATARGCLLANKDVHNLATIALTSKNMRAMLTNVASAFYKRHVSQKRYILSLGYDDLCHQITKSRKVTQLVDMLAIRQLNKNGI